MLLMLKHVCLPWCCVMRILSRGVQVVLQLPNVSGNRKNVTVSNQRGVVTMFKRHVFPKMMRPRKDRLPCTIILPMPVVGVMVVPFEIT